MSVEVKQAAYRKDNRWWRWSVWLEGSDAELNEIEAVEYTLHPSFRNPVRRITSRRSRFRLNASGWGGFRMYIKIFYIDGRVEEREHQLSLEPSATQETDTPAGTDARPAVFLSYSAVDAPFAHALAEGLKDSGIDVLTAYDELSSSVPWQASLHTMLERADHAAFVVSDHPSAWIDREAQLAEEQGLPITPITLGADLELPAALRNHQHLQIADTADIGSVVHDLARWIKKEE